MQALWYGSTRVVDGSYTGGQVVTVLLATIIGGGSIGQAGPNIQYFQGGCVAAKRVFDVISRSASTAVGASMLAAFTGPLPCADPSPAKSLPIPRAQDMAAHAEHGPSARSCT